MPGSPKVGKIFLVLAAVLLLVTALPAQVSVLTQSNNPARTGWNNQETILNTSNLNVSNFGKLFALNVDGYIYAQPLYMPNVSIGGKNHNVVFVATEHNSVYAFDADSLGPPLWQANVNAGGTPVDSNDICTASGQANYCADLIPEVGVTATPVIDPSAGTMYIVAETKASTSYHFKLHALDITTGAERPGSPVEIDGSDQSPPLNQLIQLNRPGLLLLNGKVYTAFGSNGDFVVNSVYWHGWIFAYDATTLQRRAVFDVSPNTGYLAAGGIWQGGKGLVSDGTYIYVATSNGSSTDWQGGNDYASSYLKLDQNLNVVDWFAPNNQSYLNTNPGNVDIGSGGPVLLPSSPPVLVGGGKDGILRVMNTGNLGKYNASTNQNLQNFQATNVYDRGMIFGGPVFWNSPQNGGVLYLWGPGDVIKGWKLTGSTFQTNPVTLGTIQNQESEDTLAALSISSNGSQSGSGIVWASRFLSLPTGANSKVAPGVLTAFDADNLANELWDSQQNSGRDAVNEYAKFVPPTVANGKVYLPTWVGPNVLGQNSGQLLVYGLLNSVKQFFSLSGSPSAVTVSPGQSAKYTIAINGSNGFNGAVSLACSALPSGAKCQFASNTVNAGSSTTLTITTQAPSTALLQPTHGKRSLLPLYGVLLPPFGLTLAGVGLGSRRRKLVLGLFAVLLLCLILAACGGGGSSTGGGGGGGGGGGTPPGSYSVIVTGTPSSGSQQFTTITLTVQ
ncbi:MAG TPA: hypothetical protein VFL79_06870 [Terriglobia bacterium]|nr:hypothetical protein [Terriglobia bacterium]